MISVTVIYSVKLHFVTQNKENIKLFLKEFKKLTTLNFLYHAFIKEDGLTFVHLAMYENEAVQQEILNNPIFLKFQMERDASGLAEDPKIETLSLIGSSLSLIV